MGNVRAGVRARQRTRQPVPVDPTGSADQEASSSEPIQDAATVGQPVLTTQESGNFIASMSNRIMEATNSVEFEETKSRTFPDGSAETTVTKVKVTPPAESPPSFDITNGKGGHTACSSDCNHDHLAMAAECEEQEDTPSVPVTLPIAPKHPKDAVKRCHLPQTWKRGQVDW